VNVKLTDSFMRTYDETQWLVGETKMDYYLGPMCGPGGFHFYTDPLLATLLNPAHANYAPARMFECAPGGEIMHVEDKSKSQSLCLVREIEPPIILPDQRVVFAVLAAWRSLRLRKMNIPKWDAWALDVMRGIKSARAAARAAAGSADAAAATAADAANATNAARAAATAADAAAVTAVFANANDVNLTRLNLVGLAHEAMK